MESRDCKARTGRDLMDNTRELRDEEEVKVGLLAHPSTTQRRQSPSKECEIKALSTGPWFAW